MTTPQDVPEAARAALARIRLGSREQAHRSSTDVPGLTPRSGAVPVSARAAGRRRGRPGEAEFSGPGADPRDPATIAVSARTLFRDSGWTEPLAAARLQGLWPQIVGTTVAAHATPESFDPRTGTLQVRTMSTAWAESLRLMLPDLRRAIDGAVGPGTVRDIRIDGPAVRSARGRLRVRGRGPRDTYG